MEKHREHETGIILAKHPKLNKGFAFRMMYSPAQSDASKKERIISTMIVSSIFDVVFLYHELF